MHFFKEKFVWARRKIDTTDLEHDKRIAGNYVFDEVAGIYVSCAKHNQRAKFSSDNTQQHTDLYEKQPRTELSDYKPTHDEIRRYPSRPVKPAQSDINLDYIPALAADRKKPATKLKPPGYRGRK